MVEEVLERKKGKKGRRVAQGGKEDMTSYSLLGKKPKKRRKDGPARANSMPAT